MNGRRHQMEADYVRRLLPSGRSWRRAADHALTACGLSSAAAWPVLYLGRLGDGIRQTMLAQALEVENASLVRQLNLLAEAGLIDRRADPSDRRANLLYLTPQGRAMAEQIEHIVGDVRTRALARVSDEALATALAVIDQVSDALEDEA
ncbi:MarR family winged helix-turn-helix transcriptional regulator [Stakelama saccharophila]|uniref:MarR family transcriptional regulator n=1 Tax=Stakelama saccharophila TaxID=3075605 RepID=A0ABZ0B9S2_9SPHN|nr:MarR family transcriptional regulator [Stakelama sp. W311]WNO54034.1 MarR family transcriptional regulator [Stakelama sp. W311]